MKGITHYRHERMLFALLRASLHEQKTETALFKDSTNEEWKQCYRLAVSQGVMALAWDGVMKLPVELQPPLSVKLAWAVAVEAYEKRYLHYCRTINELSHFYAQHGIAVMQLKGIGFSTLYPVPTHREGGDIDIYTYSADKNRMSDEKANRLANSLIRQKNINVDTKHSPKHSVFYYKGVPIENHKTFLNVESYQVSRTSGKGVERTYGPATNGIGRRAGAHPLTAFQHAVHRFPCSSALRERSSVAPSLRLGVPAEKLWFVYAGRRYRPPFPTFCLSTDPVIQRTTGNEYSNN